MKKNIQLLYQKGYGINKLGKGQDKPQAALITELSYCIRMKIFFLAGSQLVPVANKRDSAKHHQAEVTKNHHPCA